MLGFSGLTLLLPATYTATPDSLRFVAFSIIIYCIKYLTCFMTSDKKAWESAWSENQVISSTNASLPFLKFDQSFRVLDLGCGRGVMLEGLKEHFRVDPVGVDIVGFRCPFSFVKADIQYLPFRDGCFDVVYGLGSIEHCASTQQALDESYRILKDNGQALFTVPNKLSLHTLFERPLRQRLGLWHIGLEQSFSLLEMIRMYTASGFGGMQYNMKFWDMRGHAFPARAFMFLDNALSKLSKNWGFFVCVFGVKYVSKRLG
jgi:SAM-dependent methyltransferase